MIEMIDHPNIKPKGLIKIELFEDDKKIQEVNTHNFIAKGMDYLYKLMVKDLFTRARATGAINICSQMIDPFRFIRLTDANHPEAPETEWLLKGKEVGYADSTKTYSGSDTKLGSYNTKESFTTLKQVHMVFDFPTHAVNEPFQSIYFTSDFVDYFVSDNVRQNLQRPFVNQGEGVLFAKKHNGEIWVLHSSSSSSGSSSSSSSGSSISRYDNEFNLIQTYTLPSVVYDFEIVGDMIYYVKDTSSNQIVRAPLNNPTNWEELNVDSPSIGRYAGIIYDSTNNQFIISSSDSSSSSSSSSISRYDNEFNLISTMDYTHPNGGYYFQKLVSVDGEIFVNGYYRSYRLTETGVERVNGGLFMGEIDNMMVDRAGYIVPKFSISSRCLLDEPIHKSNNQTMKITYDFILE